MTHLSNIYFSIPPLSSSPVIPRIRISHAVICVTKCPYSLLLLSLKKVTSLLPSHTHSSNDLYTDSWYQAGDWDGLSFMTDKMPSKMRLNILLLIVTVSWQSLSLLPYSVLLFQVIPGLYRLATKVLGPSTLVQAAIPDILSSVPEEYHTQNVSLFHRNAQAVTRILSSAPGVRPVMPSATMYIMVSILYTMCPSLFPPEV